MKTIELQVEKRSTTGKNEARRDRVAGRHPGHGLRGGQAERLRSPSNRKALSDVFREGAGENAIFLLKLAAPTRAATP